MPTDNTRVQITLDNETQGLLTMLASQKHASLSATAASLIREALEQHEDMLLSELGDKRINTEEPLVSHKDAWL